MLNYFRSCHTAKDEGHILEGHVPDADVERLLSERPEARDQVVPGMPNGYPGIEIPVVSTVSHEVILFDDKHHHTFACY